MPGTVSKGLVNNGHVPSPHLRGGETVQQAADTVGMYHASGRCQQGCDIFHIELLLLFIATSFFFFSIDVLVISLFHQVIS